MKFYRGVKSLNGNVKVEFEAIRKYVQYTETEAKPKLADYSKLKLIKVVEVFLPDFPCSFRG